jgi:hypothetical protein
MTPAQIIHKFCQITFNRAGEGIRAVPLVAYGAEAGKSS